MNRLVTIKHMIILKNTFKSNTGYTHLLFTAPVGVNRVILQCRFYVGYNLVVIFRKYLYKPLHAALYEEILELTHKYLRTCV